MINYDDLTKENRHDPNWPQIPDHPYRILIIEGSGSRKTNALLNLIKKMMIMLVLLIKSIYMLKIQMNQNIDILLTNRSFKQLNNANTLIEYSNNIQDVYKNIEKDNPGRKCTVLIVFGDNRKLNQVVKELFIRG